MSYTVTEQGETVTIKVHGRGSFTIPFTDAIKAEDGTVTDRDLSDALLYFECKEIGLRKLMPADPANAMGKLVQMTRADVELLSDERVQFAVIDETDPTLPDVLWSGFVKQTGYEGAPE